MRCGLAAFRADARAADAEPGPAHAASSRALAAASAHSSATAHAPAGSWSCAHRAFSISSRHLLPPFFIALFLMLIEKESMKHAKG